MTEDSVNGAVIGELSQVQTGVGAGYGRSNIDLKLF